MRRKVFVITILVICVAIGILILANPGFFESMDGMDREEMIERLNQESWHHTECWGYNREKVWDLFLTGSHDYLKATAIVVLSEKQGDEYRVVSGVYSAPSEWQELYGLCIDEEWFKEDSGPD